MGSIAVTNLGKAYKRYASQWDRFAEWILPDASPRHELKWILQDINFVINPGEAVGIIGMNGAGKSTLLKMITGTTQPTTGSVHVGGRLAALLELGMGFHPDFTGRQNVYTAGQLLGIAVEEISALMPEIEAFAEIGEYIDQPVRVYSSGMQVRLAFAVATAKRPDILIVDEALSVGDLAFQAKCMCRMNCFMEAGVTVLFVSHSLNTVRQFCQRAIYLKNGQIAASGPADEVCDLFQNDAALGSVSLFPAKIDSPKITSFTDNHTIVRNPDLRKNSPTDLAGGSGLLEFIDFEVVDHDGTKIQSCQPSQKISFRASIVSNALVSQGTAVGLLIADKSGYHILSCNSNLYNVLLPALSQGEVLIISWDVNWPFHGGEFRIDIGLKPDPFADAFYDRVFCAATLSTQTPKRLLQENFGGFFHIPADIRIIHNNKLTA